SVQLPGGEVGHAYVQGRDKAHATRAACVDALMQTEAAADLQARVLDVLAAEAASARQLRAEKAAATKVDFFTLVRGED
ncbi:MAG: phosphonate C-P lyase system protein PhnG, partial [Pararhodobacter sp.]